MSFLKRLKDNKSRKVIKDMLHARLGGAETARGQKTIHASDLTKENNQWGVQYCPREVRLRELVPDAPKKQDQFLQVSTAVTFAEGRDKQKRFNEDWLVDAMYGDWLCLSCGDLQHFCVKPKEEGIDEEGNEHKHVWQYEEPRVIDYISKTSGGLDALVDVGAPKLRVIEVKIMKGDDFKTLKAPLSEHRVRTKLYLRQIAGSRQEFAKKIETDFAHVVYIMRGHGCKQEDGRISPFKEFIVERDDASVQHFIGMAHALTLSRKFSHIIPAGVCKTQMDDRAEKCPMAKACFAAHPATITWIKEGEPQHTGGTIQYITDGEELHDID